MPKTAEVTQEDIQSAIRYFNELLTTTEVYLPLAAGVFIRNTVRVLEKVKEQFPTNK